MKMIKDMKYFMEAPMQAFPRYSAILLALAFSIPALAQEVEDIDLEEETAAVEPAEAQPEAALTDAEKEAIFCKNALRIINH